MIGIFEFELGLIVIVGVVIVGFLKILRFFFSRFYATSSAMNFCILLFVLYSFVVCVYVILYVFVV